MSGSGPFSFSVSVGRVNNDMSLNDTAKGFGRLSEAVGKDGKVDMLETGIILDFISRRCRRMPDTDGLVKMLNAVAERGFMTESDSTSILDEL